MNFPWKYADKYDFTLYGCWLCQWSVVLWPTCGTVYATWALCRGQLANLFFSVARRSRSDVSEWVSDSSFRDFTDVTLVSDDTDKDDEDNEDDEDDEVDEADEDD